MATAKMLQCLWTVVLCTCTVQMHFHENQIPKGWGEVQRLRVVASEDHSSTLVNAAVVDRAAEDVSVPKSEDFTVSSGTILDTEFSEAGSIAPIAPKPSTAPAVVQFVWKVFNFSLIVNSGQEELLFSPRFYLNTDQSASGYRLQLLLTLNTTFLDNVSYLGVFFRLVAGDYDGSLVFPYSHSTVLSVLEHDQLTNVTRDATATETLLDWPILYSEWNHTVVPNVDECRLRSAFLRPSSDSDTSASTDGCGNRRHIPLANILNNKKFIGEDDTLLVLITVHLTAVDSETAQFPIAAVSMNYNWLVSNYEWKIESFSSKEREATEKGRIVILNSRPFYTHPYGYLIQLFFTILPKRNAFAISTSFIQGDHDRHLQWSFPYSFECAVVDQSPDYWKRDLTVKVTPSKSDCGYESFGPPTQTPEFCFLTIQSLHVLSLKHYNFLVNDTLRIRFTTRFERYSSRQRASIVLDKGRLVSEYNWLLPGLVSRMERYISESVHVPGASSPTSSASSATRRSHKFVSDEFYTNGQGYVCQLQLTITVKNVALEEMANSTTASSEHLNQTSRSGSLFSSRSGSPRMFSNNRAAQHDVLVFGLELIIIEGEFDRFLDWPFSHAYELSIVGYKNLAGPGATSGTESSEPMPSGGHFYTAESPQPEQTNSKRTSSTLVIPAHQVSSGQCSAEAFQKPIERNPPCGIREFVKLASTEESRRQRQAKRPRSEQQFTGAGGTGRTSTGQLELGTVSSKSEEDLHLRVRIYL